MQDRQRSKLFNQSCDAVVTFDTSCESQKSVPFYNLFQIFIFHLVLLQSNLTVLIIPPKLYRSSGKRHIYPLAKTDVLLYLSHFWKGMKTKQLARPFPPYSVFDLFCNLCSVWPLPWVLQAHLFSLSGSWLVWPALLQLWQAPPDNFCLEPDHHWSTC